MHEQLVPGNDVALALESFHGTNPASGTICTEATQNTPYIAPRPTPTPEDPKKIDEVAFEYEARVDSSDRHLPDPAPSSRPSTPLVGLGICLPSGGLSMNSHAQLEMMERYDLARSILIPHPTGEAESVRPTPLMIHHKTQKPAPIAAGQGPSDSPQTVLSAPSVINFGEPPKKSSSVDSGPNFKKAAMIVANSALRAALARDRYEKHDSPIEKKARMRFLELGSCENVNEVLEVLRKQQGHLGVGIEVKGPMMVGMVSKSSMGYQRGSKFASTSLARHSFSPIIITAARAKLIISRRFSNHDYKEGTRVGFNLILLKGAYIDGQMAIHGPFM
ncbi:hypothetical protein HDU67_004114 [Dinochytrium kinnereticum]|nr:hypothetical protein HDU67_004114 [Dinochytrium kinnereticum]